MQATDVRPERLGSFEILQTLGEGGSAFVYAARDGDREIALKVLRPDVGLDAREVDRFLEEADTMRRVQHRALVPVLRAGLLPGGRPYIAMPRLRGQTLAARLEIAAVPIGLALPLFEDVAHAVSMLHQAGLVHRDIKPENVFWLEQENRLVLLDLGIARDTSGLPSTTTRAGMMRGTPAYMAPERFFGKSATIRSDVYELAVLLYAMLTAKLPWDEGDATGRIQPKHPTERGVAIPEALAGVLLRALSFEVDRRPSSVDELMAQVRDASNMGMAQTNLAPITPMQRDLVAATHQETLASTYQAITPAPIVTELSPHSPIGAAYTPQVPYAPAGAYTPAAAYTPGPYTPPFAAPPTGSQGLAMPTAAPRRSSSNGLLLAIGAVIALVGAAGGALVVGMMFTKSDAPKQARARVADEDDGDSKPKQDRVASAKPVSPSPDSPAPTPVPAPSEAPRADGSAPTSPGPAPGPGSLPTPKTASTPAPTAPPAATTAAPTAPPAGGGAMPPSCTAYVALMCDPSSGARPEECSTWKSTVADWNKKYPPSQTEQMCAAALSGSKKGLEYRKASKPPP